MSSGSLGDLRFQQEVDLLLLVVHGADRHDHHGIHGHVGRTSIYNVDEMYKEDEKRVEIEMKGEPVVNATEKNQNEVLGPQNEVKPTLQGEMLVEKKEESVEKKEVAANQTEVTAAPQNEVLAPQEASAAQSEIPVTATVSA